AIECHCVVALTHLPAQSPGNMHLGCAWDSMSRQGRGPTAPSCRSDSRETAPSGGLGAHWPPPAGSYGRVPRPLRLPRFQTVQKPYGEHFLSTWGAKIALLATSTGVTGRCKARKKPPRTAFANPIPATFGRHRRPCTTRF